MKKAKRFWTVLLALAMCLAMLPLSALAVEEPDPAAMTREELAALDTTTASPELKKAILNARDLITHGEQAWTVKGAMSIIRADGTEEKLPEFRDLWPNWDLYELSVLYRDPNYFTDGFWNGRSGKEFPVKLHIMDIKERSAFTYCETTGEDDYYTVEKGTAFLAPNNAAGTNGNVCAAFTAEWPSAQFVLTDAPGAVDYNIQLYRGPMGQGEQVSDYDKVGVNNGIYLLGLVPGEEYYFKISSNTLNTGGATASYVLCY